MKRKNIEKAGTFLIVIFLICASSVTLANVVNYQNTIQTNENRECCIVND